MLDLSFAMIGCSSANKVYWATPPELASAVDILNEGGFVDESDEDN